MTRMLIVGGTGMLGSALASAATREGHHVTVAARRPDVLRNDAHSAVVNVATGAGLDEALQGQDIVVFAVNSRNRPQRVMVEGLRRVLDAMPASGGPCIVLPSIVGCDRVANTYYRSKVAQERALTEWGGPHSTIRLTQFHEFVVWILGAAARAGVTPRSGLTIQPLACSAAATAVLAHLETDASGSPFEIAGPHAATLSEFARAWGRHTGHMRIPFPLPPRMVGARSASALLPTADAVTTGLDFLQWLTHQEKEHHHA